MLHGSIYMQLKNKNLKYDVRIQNCICFVKKGLAVLSRHGKGVLRMKTLATYSRVMHLQPVAHLDVGVFVGFAFCSINLSVCLLLLNSDFEVRQCQSFELAVLHHCHCG
jgi:hypothetical protein